MTQWLVPFVWTLALELPIYALCLHRSLPRWWALVGLVVAINVATHPLLWIATSH